MKASGLLLSALLTLMGSAQAQSRSVKDSIEWILPDREMGPNRMAQRDKLALLGGKYRLVKDEQFRVKSIEWQLVMRNDSMESALPRSIERELTSIYGLPTNFPTLCNDREFADASQRDWTLDEDELTLSVCKDNCIISVLRRFNSHELQIETPSLPMGSEENHYVPASFR